MENMFQVQQDLCPAKCIILFSELHFEFVTCISRLSILLLGSAGEGCPDGIHGDGGKRKTK